MLKQNNHSCKKCNLLFMCNLCANPRTFPKHGQTHSAMAEFISTCPELVNGVWHEESRAGQRDWTESDAEWYFECGWWRSLIVPAHEFAGRSITQVVTFISPDFYQKPFYENVRMPHHIAAFTSSPFSLPPSLSKTENFIECWRDCEYIYSPADTGIWKTNFLLIFQGKGSPEFPGDESAYVLVCQKSPESLFTCLDRVKDTVKHSLPKHIFTSVLRSWVVLQKPICLSAVINNSSVLLWFSTHQRALPSKAAVPGSRCWHWKQNIQMPISQLSERRWE